MLSASSNHGWLRLVAKREGVSPWPAGWALRELQAGLTMWASTATAESKAAQGREATALQTADATVRKTHLKFNGYLKNN